VKLRSGALLAVLLMGFARAAGPDYARMTDEQLVDSLQAVKDETVGIDSMAIARAFLAEDKPPKFVGGVLGTREPTAYPQMRLLVQHGVAALPVLLRHLDDARPTQLSEPPPKSVIMWSFLGNEYDPRNGKPTWFHLYGKEPEPKLPYTVKVGDVCFALVGQIVGRSLLPIRYQPTGGMIINSPVEKPELAKKVREDWAGLTVDDFRKQLLADVRQRQNPFGPNPLPRLRYYFPAEYAKQRAGGELKQAIAAFEADEKKS
jgi:hypothetical protein